jgi:hypothetical protein
MMKDACGVHQGAGNSLCTKGRGIKWMPIAVVVHVQLNVLSYDR